MQEKTRKDYINEIEELIFEEDGVDIRRESLEILKIAEMRMANDLFRRVHVIASDDSYPSALEKMASSLENINNNMPLL